MSHDEPLRRSQRARSSTISDDYELYVNEEIQIEGDSTSFEEVMRSAHSSKWLQNMEDEMRSMSTNKFLGLEEILKGPQQWVAKHTSKGISKDIKHNLFLKASHEGKR
jgi:hypothetical protein